MCVFDVEVEVVVVGLHVDVDCVVDVVYVVWCVDFGVVFVWIHVGEFDEGVYAEWDLVRELDLFI